MSETLASKIEFKDLCTVLENVSKARAAKKAEILDKFIQRCRKMRHKLKTEFPDMDVSLFPILRLILPHLERERSALNLKARSLATLYIRVFCLGKNSQNATKLIQYKVPTSKKVAGRDFAEIAHNILQNRLPRTNSDFTIDKINLFLESISSKSENIRQKDEKFKVLLGKVNGLEFKWITRIILKDLRLGIGTKKILSVFHQDANSLFDVSTDLRQVCDTLCDPQMRYHHDIQVFSHFKPMLLERSKIEDAGKLFNKGEKYFVQCKFDGERSQVHMKDGKYKYFTRNGYDITNYPMYGETNSSGFMSGVFGRLLNPQVKSVILDGELMGWHKEKKVLGSKGMNYDVKKLSENSHHQPCFVAFDIVMYNDDLLHNEPYEKRLEILKDVFKEEEGSLILCKCTKISKSAELCKIFNESIENKEEGIVLKICDSKYKPNVRDGTGCYKIKAEYSEDLVHDVDLIIIGGYYGNGKFMGLIKSFLMGVASPPDIPGENPTKFFSVVSVSNGFSMDTLKELRTMFENKWQTECPENVVPPRLEPPDRWIQPENSIIITIRASEMTRSKDYPLGYSLRFPKVMNVRTDKPWYNVCTTTELLSLIKDTRPIQKMTKRGVNPEDIAEEISEAKVRKTTSRRSTKFEEMLSKPNIFDNPPVSLTRLFDNKKICVVNGDNELSTEKIEEILLQHKAEVVKNPVKDTYCIIVGNAKKFRASHYIQTKQYDVVTVDWFKRVTKEENWPLLEDFLPWDLISTSESTKCRLAQYYDDYYDHYTVDANEESLLRSFKRIEETVSYYQFTVAQNKTRTLTFSCFMIGNVKNDELIKCSEMKSIDEKLFDSGISPYSLFRGIVGYFNDQSDLTKCEFRFMAGIIKETIDDSVTHVFVNKNSIGTEVQNFIDSKSQTTLILIKSEWISECFKQNAIIPYEEYLIQ